MTTETKCPFNHVAGVGRTNQDWWPNRLRLELLHPRHNKLEAVPLLNFALHPFQYTNRNANNC